MNVQEMEDAVLKLLRSNRQQKRKLNLSADQREALYGFAFRCYEARAYEDAERVFSFLALDDKHEPRYVFGLASCMKMQQRFAEAAQVYLVALLLDACDGAAALYAAECWLACGEHVEAARALLDLVVTDGELRTSAAMRDRARGILQLLAARASKEGCVG